MSSEIIYHQVAVRIPAEHAGSTEDLFVHMVQQGSSNSYEYGRNGKDGRRSRSWSAISFGTAKEVLTQGIKWGGDAEGGMLKYAKGEITPEQHIRKVRSLIEEAKKTDVRQALLYRNEHVWITIEYRETDEGCASKTTPYKIRDPKSFHAFWQRYEVEGKGKSAWNFFQVSGPELR